MPRISDPLLIHAKNLRDGFYAAEMTPRELASFETRLLHTVERRLAMLDAILVRVSELLKQSAQADLKKFLRLANSFFRVFNTANRLERFRQYLLQRQRENDEIALDLLLLEADDSADQINRSSIKTKKIYSKFPPRQAAMDLTDEQWQIIQHLLPRKKVLTPGRPPQSMREVLNAIFWKLRTGAPWDQIPSGYPSHQTCYRYYSVWEADGVLTSIIKVLGRDLERRGGVNLLRSLESGEMDIVRIGRKSHIRLPSRLQDTWKGSTVLVIMQYLYKKGDRSAGSSSRLSVVHQRISSQNDSSPSSK